MKVSPQRPGLSLSRLRALSAVVQEGSFAAAARSLGVAQPSVAQQIQELEASYGVHLFDRKPSGLQPTALCLELSDIAERVHQSEREAQRILARCDVHGLPVLRVGMANTMPGLSIIDRLLMQNPDLSVRVQSGTQEAILSALRGRDVDVVVVPDLAADRRFRRMVLQRQHIVALVARGHPLAGRSAVDLAELARHPLIFRAGGSSSQKAIDRAFRGVGLIPRPRMIADTREAVVDAVALGVGVGFIWSGGMLRRSSLIRVPVVGLTQPVDEVILAHADDDNALINRFFHAAASDGLPPR